LYSPLEAGCTLVKNPKHLIDAYSSHPEYYNFSKNEDGLVQNYYEYGLQNSRGFRALKVWLAFQQLGRSGYVKLISITKYLQHYLKLNKLQNMINKSESQCIPYKFMDAVIHALKVAGLIVRMPGNKSGYQLAKTPSKITAYDVYRAFEPKLHIHFCLADKEICPRACTCASRYFLSNFNQKMESFMQENSIENLVNIQKDLNGRSFTAGQWVI